jgi:hypothetical protein
MAYGDDALSAWTTFALTVYEGTVPDEFACSAADAVAKRMVDRMAGLGFRAPAAALRMFTDLPEAGYAQALVDVRDARSRP